MSQNLNLSVAGIYTALSDYNGLPPGALDAAVNVECRFKNLLEPRRGFEGLANTEVVNRKWIRLTNFWINEDDLIIGLDDVGSLFYYNGTAWVAVAGDYSTNIMPPDPVNAKSRFVVAGQNLYVTGNDGIRSLSSGSGAEILRAGVPKGLNLEAETNGDQSGFFNNNVLLTTTGDISSGSALLTNLEDATGIQIGQYVTGIDVEATLVVQDLTYTAETFGSAGNSITIAYTTGGTAGAEVVSVVGTAISVQIQTAVSTATQIRTAVLASAPATALVSVTVSGTGSNAQTAPTGPTPLAGGLDNTIPTGTVISAISAEAPIIIQAGDTTAGSTSITNLPSITGIVAGVLVSGDGITSDATVVSTSGAGPYTVVLNSAAFKTATGVNVTFTAPIIVTLDQNALASLSGTPISFYEGSQVGYRMVFGRVESDRSGGSITRLGAPSSAAIATNISGSSTNTTVTGTLPKNSSGEITFVQLYRSEQTDQAAIAPLDQYRLVYERALESADFVARTITIEDQVPDSLKGIPLYAGSDQEGILQSNNPPPMAWDMCKFRDFTLYGNITQPSTLSFTIVAVGSPNGVQIGDTITISGMFAGSPFSGVYTGASAENPATGAFDVVTGGTPSQNVTDTANSLIRVINYDNDTPVHAILISSATDLPGQIILEFDYPSYDTFNVTASAHATAYDPTLTDLTSEINTVNNGILVSKTGEFEAVPATNLLFAGDSSSDLVRVIALRDYVVVLKTDGIYKIQGITPNGLVVNPFDLTTKIIGSDTAVSLNSGVWMLSNQGVVSISDGGVDAKSVPIDDQLNRLIGSYLDNLKDVAFAIGYESDRKYILCVPDSENPFAEVEYNFNYVTNAWTTWDRLLFYGFIHSNEDKLYISRANPTDQSVSKERKQATYKDYVDESEANEILTIDETVIGLVTVDGVEVGDILYQSDTLFSPIYEVDLINATITVQAALSFTVGACQILKAYDCDIIWKQVFGDNPAFLRQFSEGLVLFKNTRFNLATASFVTDFSQALAEVELTGSGNALWGLFPWGLIPWGGNNVPSTIRFYIPQDKQLGSILIPRINIRQGYSDFKFQGMSITFFNVGSEVGK